MKELYCEWFDWVKTSEDIKEVKERLEEFYRNVEAADVSAFHKAIKTFKNWQPEVLNSFIFPYSNGFLRGLIIKGK